MLIKGLILWRRWHSVTDIQMGCHCINLIHHRSLMGMEISIHLLLVNEGTDDELILPHYVTQMLVYKGIRLWCAWKHRGHGLILWLVHGWFIH